MHLPKFLNPQPLALTPRRQSFTYVKLNPFNRIYPELSTLTPILTSTPIPDSEPQPLTLHLLAAGNGHDEMASLLLHKGAAVDAKDEDGKGILLCIMVPNPHPSPLPLKS